MQLAVLGASESWYLRDLQRAAGETHQITSLPFSRLTAASGESPVKITSLASNLKQFDAVLVRTMPPGSLEQVVFRMDALGRLAAGGTLVLNPPRAIETAVDKFLTTARLAEQGIPTPRTVVCQQAEEAMGAFESLGGDVVIKPIFGSEGRGIARLQDPALAFRTFRMLERMQAVIYVQQFIPHAGFDVRVLFLGETSYAMRRRNPDDWRTNASRGAICEPIALEADVERLARQAAATIEAPLSGVDILTGLDGQLYVLEVNAVPGWKAMSAATGIDIAARILQFIDRKLAPFSASVEPAT